MKIYLLFAVAFMALGCASPVTTTSNVESTSKVTSESEERDQSEDFVQQVRRYNSVFEKR